MNLVLGTLHISLVEIPQDPRDSCGYGHRNKVFDLEAFGQQIIASTVLHSYGE